MATYHAGAIKSDKTLWTWGRAYRGSLGDDTTTDKSSPVLVVGNHNFIELSTGTDITIARKDDSTMWGWEVIGMLN